MDLLYESGQYTNLDLDPNTFVPAHTTYSARLILGREGSIWKLVLGGSNLTNASYANQIVNAAFFPGSYAVTQAAGRSFSSAAIGELVGRRRSGRILALMLLVALL